MDFSSLVLAPAMAVFAQPITVTPVASQPGAPAYPARGSWSWKPAEEELPDGTYHSTNQPALGIRLADFAVPPKQNDTVVTAQGAFTIIDVVPDGQGGADLKLRQTDGL